MSDFLTEWRPTEPPTRPGAVLLRANALNLPIDDETVDLVVTSPPYFALRDYRDGDGSLDGQIGAEPTPQDFLESLWAATREMIRVLKPSGSIWVNLGDKYAGSGGHNNSNIGAKSARGPKSYNKNAGVPAKSLMGLPWRYAIGCVDDLGLILRSEVIWQKPNGLPDNAGDRVQRKHEQWFHFTKNPTYYSAIDEIREPHAAHTLYCAEWESAQGGYKRTRTNPNRVDGGNTTATNPPNPLGKLPGSVWNVATDPLRVPEHLNTDHFAAFPQEFPRRIILGWSPAGVCSACGDGRVPVVEKDPGVHERDTPKYTEHGANHGGAGSTLGNRGPSARIVGEKCACTDTSAQTNPGIVLDPFGGTGTTAMVARALGRFGVSVDLSMDYLRLAQWRIFESGHAQKSIKRTADARGDLW